MDLHEEYEQLMKFGMVGIQNTGAICYFNCILQFLLHYEPFKMPIINGTNWSHNENILFRDYLFNQTFFQSNKAPLELLQQYIGGFEKYSIQEDFFDIYNKMIVSFPQNIQKMFEMEMCEVTRDENKDKISENIYSNLSLIVDTNSIDLDCFLLDLITEEKTFLDNNEDYISRQTFFLSPPSILTFQVQRGKDGNGMKDCGIMNFAKVIDIRHCLVDPCDDPVSYMLFALIIHSGRNINYGHYSIYIYNGKDNQYYLFNDSQVRPVGESEMSRFTQNNLDYSTSYGFIYQNDNLPNSSSIKLDGLKEHLIDFFCELLEEEEEEEDEVTEINKESNQIDQEIPINTNDPFLLTSNLNSDNSESIPRIETVDQILRIAHASHGQIDLLSSKDLKALQTYIESSPAIRDLVVKAITIDERDKLEVPLFTQPVSVIQKQSPTKSLSQPKRLRVTVTDEQRNHLTHLYNEHGKNKSLSQYSNESGIRINYCAKLIGRLRKGESIEKKTT